MAANRWTCRPTRIGCASRTHAAAAARSGACAGRSLLRRRADWTSCAIVSSPLAVERGFDSLLDYYYLLKYDADAAAEWMRAIDALSVQETYFWREADQLPGAGRRSSCRAGQRGRRTIRIWSMPCATGEEPLSIAMALSEAGWFDGRHRDSRQRRQRSGADRARAGRYGGARSASCRRPARTYFSTTGARGVDGSSRNCMPGATSGPASTSSSHEHWGPRGVRRRDLLPQSVHLFRLRPPSAGRDLACRRDAVAGLLVRRRGRIAACGSPRRFELQDVGGAFVYVKP